jgi:hypothetical protein
VEAEAGARAVRRVVSWAVKWVCCVSTLLTPHQHTHTVEAYAKRHYSPHHTHLTHPQTEPDAVPFQRRVELCAETLGLRVQRRHHSLHFTTTSAAAGSGGGWHQRVVVTRRRSDG